MSQSPLTGCTITAGSVKMKSAMTTIRAVAAIPATSFFKCAINMKKAMPAPVPKRTAALRIWIVLTMR